VPAMPWGAAEWRHVALWRGIFTPSEALAQTMPTSLLTAYCVCSDAQSWTRSPLDVGNAWTMLTQ
jgi:hypothetical protein